MEYVYFILLIAVGVFAAFLYSSLKERNVLSKLSKALDIRLSGAKGSAAWHGIEFEYDYYSGDENTPSHFSISRPCAASGNFYITAKADTGARNLINMKGIRHLANKVVKSMGLSNEIKTHDPDFDKDFYVTAETTGFAAGFLESRDKRQAIKEIFLSGSQSIRCDGRSISVFWEPFPYKGKAEYSSIPAAIHNLARLTGEI